MAQQSVQDRIMYAATENNALLKTLQETDYASGAIQQNRAYMSTLTKQIKESESRLHQLDISRRKEQKDHEKYRDSTMKRLAFKLSGKGEAFTQKQAKEEREYLEAIQAHFEETKCLESLKSSSREAQETQQELEGADMRHKSAQEALDRLYKSLFDGPTPGFPDEDRAEGAVQLPKEQFQAAQQRFSAESHVLAILGKALQALTMAARSMAKAESASQKDIMGWGGSFADMAERSALADAQQWVAECRMHLGGARQLSDEIGDIGPMRIAEGHFMSDILFDNVFTDIAFHRKIQDSAGQVMAAHRKLKGEVQKAEERVMQARASADEASRRLTAARENLQRVRASVFERVAGGLPEYSA